MREAGFFCGEVRGGNGIIKASVSLPGLRGVLYSRPCEGATGGDIHYLSVCGSGLMARICLADVAGHGPTASAVGMEMHVHLRQSVDIVDERRVLARLNERLSDKGLRVMTTAVLATYYPPRRRLTVCYAGHPPGWRYHAATKTWTPLKLPVTPPATRPAFVDMPVGTGFTPEWNRHRFHMSVGDRLLLLTDGVLETMSPEAEPFDARALEGVLAAATGDCDSVADQLLAALHAHASADQLAHDDVTFFLAEVEEGPRGPAVWHVIKNRLLSRGRSPGGST